jgi:hypothetical protein
MEKRKRSQPEFDWSNISYGDSERISLVSIKVARARATNDDGLLVEAFAEMRSILAEHLIHVPQDWLISSAPDTNTIDWRNPDNLRAYLRSDKGVALMQAYGNADPLDGSAAS